MVLVNKFVNQFGQAKASTSFTEKQEITNYERILAKNRPVTPHNNGYIYTAYLMNIAHFVSRQLTGDNKVLVAEDT